MNIAYANKYLPSRVMVTLMQKTKNYTDFRVTNHDKPEHRFNKSKMHKFENLFEIM